MAALTAAHELRLEIPRDLSVAGFDDTSSSRFAWPPLTTVRQPITEVARVATEVLLRQLRDRATQQHGSDRRLRAEIVRRASTGRAG
jgi:LacI family transcriptional regulator